MSDILTPTNAADRLMAAVPNLVLKSPSEKALELGTVTGLFGPSGGGKTTLAASILKNPEARPALYLDARGGSGSIAHLTKADGIEMVHITAWLQVQVLTEQFKKTKDAFGFKTVIHDVVSEFANLAINAVHPSLGSSVEIQEYGQVTRYVLDFIRSWSDIAAASGINVIFIFWDADDVDEGTKVTKKAFSLTNKLQEQTPGLIEHSIGWVGPVPFGTFPNERILDFTPSTKSISRLRRSLDSAMQSIPYQLIWRADQAPMADIINTMKGVPFPTGNYRYLNVPKPAETKPAETRPETKEETTNAVD